MMIGPNGLHVNSVKEKAYVKGTSNFENCKADYQVYALKLITIFW